MHHVFKEMNNVSSQKWSEYQSQLCSTQLTVHSSTVPTNKLAPQHGLQNKGTKPKRQRAQELVPESILSKCLPPVLLHLLPVNISLCWFSSSSWLGKYRTLDGELPYLVISQFFVMLHPEFEAAFCAGGSFFPHYTEVLTWGTDSCERGAKSWYAEIGVHNFSINAVQGGSYNSGILPLALDDFAKP